MSHASAISGWKTAIVSRNFFSCCGELSFHLGKPQGGIGWPKLREPGTYSRDIFLRWSSSHIRHAVGEDVQECTRKRVTKSAGTKDLALHIYVHYLQNSTRTAM